MSFFYGTKKRKCKFEVLPQSDFCQYHSLSQDYIQCPIDSSHTILKAKLELHIKICPKSKYESSLKENVWFSKGINSTQKEEEVPKKDGKTGKILIELLENNPKKLSLIIEKIEKAFYLAIKIYESSMNKVFTNKSDEYFMPSSKIEITSLSKNEKDSKQLMLMIKLMQEFNLLNKNYVYIEYGAGKGHLSHEIAVMNEDKSAHILLEREARRNKFDKHHRNNENFIRLRIDINDFDINNLNQIIKNVQNQAEGLKIVGVSKHMCGGATDLSLNSLLNSKEKNILMEGLCIATCCHHNCSVDTYCNMEFLYELGLEKDEIPYFFKMSSWAFSLLYEEKKEKGEKEEIFNLDKKTEIGFKIKRIIDIGRCLYLKAKILRDVWLVKYCDLDLTPENFVIVFNNK